MAAPIETPQPTDDRLVVELVASEPDIVTPTGISVDERGRVWVIENQTHHRPADYKGPAGDRIRIYDDFGPDGRARRIKTFAEGFKNSMGLAFGPGGKLPGTLPMVAGTGEAPSGIVAYESNGLPPEYIGDLIVTSWGDHIIQRFKLAERGASFTSQPQTMVRGSESFYPVGIAITPDGSLVVSDWADKSYPLHGKGRIWRLRAKHPPPDD